MEIIVETAIVCVAVWLLCRLLCTILTFAANILVLGLIAAATVIRVLIVAILWLADRKPAEQGNSGQQCPHVTPEY